MVGKLTPDSIATASVIPTIMGLSRYATPNDALANALAAMEGRTPEFKGNEATHWGDALEPIIIAEAAHRLGLKNLRTEFDKAFFHSTLALACSLDGTAEGDGLLAPSYKKRIFCMNGIDGRIDISGTGIIESKLTSAAPEDFPQPFRGPWQLQAQMMCTGYNWGVVATLYRGIELRLFVYQADKEMQRQIVAAVDDFERRKRNGDWYPAASSDDANTAYSHVDDGVDDIPLDNDETGIAALREFIEAKAERDAVDSRVESAEMALKEIIGNHEGVTGTIGNTRYRVTWPMRTYKAQPEKVVPAKLGYVTRQKTLTVKEVY